jgi:putative transposase
VNLVLTYFKRLFRSCLDKLRSRFARWTQPLTSSLLLESLADLGRSKPQLRAENALLCQQLIILHRQVKRPACTKADRTRLVLLARSVRTWRQALFIVQPETL